jgi:hypothetical protein
MNFFDRGGFENSKSSSVNSMPAPYITEGLAGSDIN